MKEKSKKPLLFRIIKNLLFLCYRNHSFEGEEWNEEAVIYVGNHAQIYGPIVAELYFPDHVYTWCAGQMMHKKEVPTYAFQDFWSQKPRWMHPYFKVLSHLIAPLSEVLFQNARTVPVYRDHRIMTTFKKSMHYLT